MSFFKKLFGKPGESTPKPAWASFMSPQRFQSFKSVLESKIRQRDPTVIIDWESGCWSSGPDCRIVNGMMNLAQTCAPLNDRETAIEIDHFFKVSDDGLVPRVPEPFDSVRKILKVRLYPLDLAQDFMVLAPYCDSFKTALALDYPDHVASVRKDDFEFWGVPTHELFRIGLENVFRQEAIEKSEAKDSSGGTAYFIGGESFFTATHALMLNRHFDFDEDLGCLVAIPNRHEVVCHPVSKTVGSALAPLCKLAQDFYEAGPGSITPDVLWFRRGQFEKLDLVFQDGKIGFKGPAELADILFE